MQAEIQKQLRMMPGQEKMLQEYYQNNPAVLGNLRGQLYEEKILKEIKSKAKSNLIEITKDQAEKRLKEENDKHMKDQHSHEHKHERSSKKSSNIEKTKSTAKKSTKVKKVSKK